MELPLASLPGVISEEVVPVLKQSNLAPIHVMSS